MSGTVIGGLRASMKNLAKDPNFYRKIGKIGGQNGNTGGFASKSYEFNAMCGAKGGRISKRKKNV